MVQANEPSSFLDGSSNERSIAGGYVIFIFRALLAH